MTDRIGRYKEAMSRSQIALVERLFGEEMQAVGYSRSNDDNVSFTSEEQKSFQKAESSYQEMVSGEIRRRHRRRGKLKLRAYQIFGRALDLIPSRRVAITDQDWLLLAEEAARPESVSLCRKDRGCGNEPSEILPSRIYRS